MTYLPLSTPFFFFIFFFSSKVWIYLKSLARLNPWRGGSYFEKRAGCGSRGRTWGRSSSQWSQKKAVGASQTLGRPQRDRAPPESLQHARKPLIFVVFLFFCVFLIALRAGKKGARVFFFPHFR